MKTYKLLQYQLVMKKVQKKEFHPEEPVVKCHQQSSNSCCFISLASAFYSIGYKKDETDLVNHVEESLTLHKNRFRNMVDFDNDIMRKQLRHKNEQHLRYNMKK